jgi:hypothetical protein
MKEDKQKYFQIKTVLPSDIAIETIGEMNPKKATKTERIETMQR